MVVVGKQRNALHDKLRDESCRVPTSGQRSHHEESEKHALFISFDKAAPDPGYGLAIERQVSESSGVYVSGVTHIMAGTTKFTSLMTESYFH